MSTITNDAYYVMRCGALRYRYTSCCVRLIASHAMRTGVLARIVQDDSYCSPKLSGHTCKCVNDITLTTNSRGQGHCNVLKDHSLYLTSLTSHLSSEASMHKVVILHNTNVITMLSPLHDNAQYVTCFHSCSVLLYSDSHYKHWLILIVRVNV
jgi:hypothetical protein